MTGEVGSIVFDLRADISAFQRNMDRAGRSVQGFSGRIGRMSATLARVGTIAAGMATAVGIAGAAMGRAAARSAVEIENLSRIAGASTTEFQRMAAAADTVQVSQEKLADILRDVQDRVGDFLSTGGGPMADFFENIAPRVGVTAEAFARLSGPEALQLYVSSLERANLTQAEMTFYMEAMASDSTALLPLLRDNGRALQDLGDAAERAGRVMSSEAIENGRELDDTLRRVSDTIRNSFNNVILENSDEIIALAETIEETWIPALVKVAGFIGDVIGLIAEMIRTIGRGISAIREFVSASDEALQAGTAAGMRQAEIDYMRRRGMLRPDWTGFEPGDPRGDDVAAGRVNPFALPPPASPRGVFDGITSDDLIPAPVPLPPAAVLTDEAVPERFRRGGGGGGGIDYRAQFEALQARFATEQEIIQENYERQLEQLRVFREQRVATEEEFNELEQRIHADHAEALNRQEEAARRAQLQIITGAMGDLATILEASGSRNIEIVRGLRVAEALISGYQAAVEAWRAGMARGGPGMAAAYTAASLLRTGALIAQMKSVTAKGGGGGAAAVAGDGGAPGAGSAGSDRPSVALTLIGDQGFTRAQIVQIAEALNESGDEGQQLVQIRGRR